MDTTVRWRPLDSKDYRIVPYNVRKDLLENLLIFIFTSRDKEEKKLHFGGSPGPLLGFLFEFSRPFLTFSSWKGSGIANVIDFLSFYILPPLSRII